MSEPDWPQMGDPLNDRLPPARRSGNVADAHDQVIQAQLDAAHDEINRLRAAPLAEYPLNEIDRLRGRESQLEAQVETLEIVISRLRSICDAAFTLVREDDDELVDLQWCVLVCALEDARYEPRS